MNMQASTAIASSLTHILEGWKYNWQSTTCWCGVSCFGVGGQERQRRTEREESVERHLMAMSKSKQSP